MNRAIYIKNDNLLIVTLAAARTGLAINGAAVLVTLYDEDGQPVAGQAWPQAVAYDVGSDGVYVGGFEDTLVLDEGSTYYALVSIDAGGGLKAQLKLQLEAVERMG
jgi:hypothetical protein